MYSSFEYMNIYECSQVLNNYELYYVIMQCDKF